MIIRMINRRCLNTESYSLFLQCLQAHDWDEEGEEQKEDHEEGTRNGNKSMNEAKQQKKQKNIGKQKNKKTKKNYIQPTLGLSCPRSRLDIVFFVFLFFVFPMFFWFFSCLVWFSNVFLVFGFNTSDLSIWDWR